MKYSIADALSAHRVPGAALCLALIALSGAAFAQDGAQGREVVVTATRLPTAIEEVGSSVTVITREEIERNQSRTLVDVLETVPGLRVVQLGGPGTQASLFARGGNSNHALVLIDGLEAMDPSAPTGAFNFAHLLPENVERIEVVRGPQSTLYGSDAIGTVVNIITRKGSGAPSATGRIEAGSRWTVSPSAGFQGAFGKANVAANVTAYRTEGESITAKRVRPAGAPAEADAYENLTASTRLGADIGERAEVGVIARYIHVDGDTDPAAEDPNARFIEDQYFLRLESKGRFFGGFWEPTLALNHTRYERETTDDPDSISSTIGRESNLGTKHKAELQNDLHLSDGNTLTVGLEAETERLDQTTDSNFGGFIVRGSTDANVDSRAAYIQDRIVLSDRLSGTVGVRRDDHQSFGGQTTWRVTPVVQFPETGTRLKASYGTGYRAPALFELFGRTFNNFGGAFNGNPNLRPEESRGWEAGFEQALFGGKAKLGSTYFENDIENLIVCSITTCTNTSDAETWGVESFASVDPVSWLTLRLAHTYTRAEDAALDSDLRRRPKHKADISLTWRPTTASRLTLAMTALSRQKDVDFVTGGDTFLGGRTLFNLYGSHDVNERFALYARAENLLDRDYEVADGFAGRSLTLIAGVRGRF